nr:uncharacterized protein LOC109159798 [Ipomoea batatas]
MWAALDLRRQVDGLCTLWQDLIKPIRASTRVDRIQWSPPSSGRLKCNVDAAIFGDRAGFGAVIRDHQGLAKDTWLGHAAATQYKDEI